MKHIIAFSLVFFSAFCGWTQHVILPGEPGFPEQYADYDFKDKFATLIATDELNNYYLADFKEMPSRFERIYFMNMSFSADHLVNLYFDDEKNIVCFKAHVKYPEADILAKLEDLLTKTRLVYNTYTPDQQTEWLKNNDKYKEKAL